MIETDITHSMRRRRYHDDDDVRILLVLHIHVPYTHHTFFHFNPPLTTHIHQAAL